MRSSLLNIFSASTLTLLLFTLYSCDKVDVTFGSETQNGDPNITYYQDYQVSLQTLQIDSFLTSSLNTFTIGYHKDPVFGTINAGSYARLEPPLTNVIKDQNVSFDSLTVILKPKGTYYGDTTKPVTLRVYQLTDRIQNTIISNNNYYNPRKFSHNAAPLGQTSVTVAPNKGQEISIRISDALGQDLLNKFQTGANEITSADNFNNYFNGIYIDEDSTLSNTLYNFTSDADSVSMRLYYSAHGLTTVEKTIDFTYDAAKQFSHIEYNHAGTALASFTPFKTNQLLTSDFIGNKAYLNPTMGKYIKISFPNILTLKQLHPYVKIVSAVLIVPPAPGTYSYPYKLPSIVNAYSTDINNKILGSIVDASGAAQYGNLVIDNLYGQSTQYSYDITEFITSLLNQGEASTSAILLAPSSSLGDESLERLVINDQNLAKGIQLKLYVLGI